MRYHLVMRTTLDIDEDVLAAAKELARAQGKTAGQVISELARRALTAPSTRSADGSGFEEEATMFDAADTRPLSWITLPNRGGVVVTPEMIRRVQDEIDIEDATPWDHATDRPRVFPEHGRERK